MDVYGEQKSEPTVASKEAALPHTINKDGF